MTQVHVRARLPVLGLRKDQETTVEETDDVKVLIADGKLYVLARTPDAEDFDGDEAYPECTEPECILYAHDGDHSDVLGMHWATGDRAWVEGTANPTETRPTVGTRQEGWLVDNSLPGEYDAIHGEAEIDDPTWNVQDPAE